MWKVVVVFIKKQKKKQKTIISVCESQSFFSRKEMQFSWLLSFYIDANILVKNLE